MNFNVFKTAFLLIELVGRLGQSFTKLESEVKQSDTGLKRSLISI